MHYEVIHNVRFNTLYLSINNCCVIILADLLLRLKLVVCHVF